MTQAFADDDFMNDGYLHIPRCDVDIIKPSMQGWTETGDFVFSINARGDRLVFKLVDQPGIMSEKNKEILGLEAGGDSLLGEFPDAETYICILEAAIVALVRTYCPSHRITLQQSVWEHYADCPIMVELDGATQILTVESIDTPTD